MSNMKRWYMDLRISTKMFISFGSIVLLTALIGIVGIYELRSTNSEYEEMYGRYGVGTVYIGYIGMQYNQTHTNTIVLLAGTATDEGAIPDRVKGFNERIITNMESYMQAIKDEEEIARVSLLKQNLEDYFELQAEIVELHLAGKNDEAYELLYGDGYDLNLEINAMIEEIMEGDVLGATDTIFKLDTKIGRTQGIMLVIFALSIAMATFAITFLVKTIANRVTHLAGLSEKIAMGDVEIEIDEESISKDEIGVLTDSYSKIIRSIRIQTETAKKIADGDFSEKCVVRSDKDVLSMSINMIVEQLQSLDSQIDMIAEDAAEGRLDARNDTLEFKGKYKEIVEKLYAALDDFKNPIMYVASILEGISIGTLGDGLPTNTKEYKGDYKELTDSLEKVMGTITALYNEINKLLDASEEGNLRVRGDVDLVPGAFKDMVRGVNGIMDKMLEPIREASTVLGKVSKGDLTVQVDGDYKGDYAIIKNSLNYTLNTFNELINNINFASEQVAAGANQISNSSILLSEGTTEQASSIEELTASAEEIASQTQLNAENAIEADKLSQTAKGNGLEGRRRMQDLVNAIDEVNDASNDISAVIKVIEDIAFQTNILALNAAVEAARAGQYGKGFAVVAEEVKSLAERSADAAKETTEMIEGSIKKSERGKDLADETASDLEVLVKDVDRVAELVDSIAKASNEQAIGIDQINQGILQVSEVVQSNSATSEETAAASEELSSQADILKSDVSKFKLREQVQVKHNSKIMNSEIDKMLSSMAKEKRSEPKKKVTINLDDNDFGKY